MTAGTFPHRYKTEAMAGWSSFHPVMSILSYLIKAPCVPPGAPVVNALYKQRACIENIFRACVGLPPDSCMGLEHKRGMADAARLRATEEHLAKGPRSKRPRSP